MRHEIAIGMNQKGLLCDRKGRRAHVHPSRQEALLMRLSVDSLRRVVKRDLAIEFVPQQLTSFGGLELLRRYVQRLALAARLRRACAALGGDYSGASLGLLILALLYAGARRLEHLQYLAGDPLVTRFCGLAQVPTPRTVSNWLQRFTQEHLRPLVQLNHDLVTEAIARLKLPRLTIDVDGTVIRTGATVAWAFRGFNPHHRKDPSYYPLVAHLAQTGHILRLKNRPGNVHDSKQAVAFLRELIESLRGRLGRALPLEFRMDAAFCQRDVFRLLAARRCAYAIKVGYWSWLPLKALAAAAVPPPRHYGANSAWQQLSILAHNVARSFQLDTLAEPKPRSRKRTYAYVLRSMRTLRFLLITRAGRLTRIDGRNVLRLAANPATEQLYAKVTHALAA